MKLTGVLLIGLLAVSALLLTIDVNAQDSTPVKGLIESDTTWTKAGSPYELRGPVGIKEGSTLTIEAGTTVNLNAFYIQVNGTLIARGIGFNKGFIAFTPKSTSWNEQTGKGNILENCMITELLPGTYYGETKYSSSLTIEGSSPKVTKCDLPSVNITNGSPIINENTINKLSINGGNPIVSSNEIQSNLLCEGSPTIWNNRISCSPKSEYAAEEIPIISFRGNGIISNNYITGLVTPAGPDPLSYGQRTIGPLSFEHGIKVNGDALISNNLITGCTMEDIIVAGGNPTIKNNTLNHGITIEAGSPKIKYNNIPIAINTTTYYLHMNNRGASNVDATNNWWGTINPEFEKIIYDSHDDFSLGEVTFSPILSSPNPQAQPDPNAQKPTNPQGTEQPIVGSVNLFGFDWEKTTLIILIVVVGALLIVIGVLLHKSRRK